MKNMFEILSSLLALLSGVSFSLEAVHFFNRWYIYDNTCDECTRCYQLILNTGLLEKMSELEFVFILTMIISCVIFVKTLHLAFYGPNIKSEAKVVVYSFFMLILVFLTMGYLSKTSETGFSLSSQTNITQSTSTTLMESVIKLSEDTSKCDKSMDLESSAVVLSIKILWLEFFVSIAVAVSATLMAVASIVQRNNMLPDEDATENNRTESMKRKQAELSFLISIY